MWHLTAQPNLCLRDPLKFKPLFLLVFVLLLGCSSSFVSERPAKNSPPSPTSLLLVPGQMPLPQSIKGVEFFRKGYPGNPAVIRLGSSDRVVLQFDELSSISGQFSVKFTHHNKNWEPSSLTDIWLFDGVNQLTIQGGQLNRFSQPRYYHYEFEFPNRNLSFLSSGNYMMHVFDFQSGVELFSLPFFVTENEGTFEPYSETVFNSGQYGAAEDQLYGEFLYPEFVQFPQFDLSYVLVQNRFLNQVKSPEHTNFLKEGSTTFRLTRNQLFPAYFDFNLLDLEPLSLQNPQIYEYQRGVVPERVYLKPDYFNFSTVANNGQQNGLGQPAPSRDAKYVNVYFSFEGGGTITSNEEVYLIGDFTQWSVDPKYKLNYNAESTRFETNVLIKEGSYSYKYVTVQNGRINTLYLSERISSQPQEYMAFVYYRDPQYHFDRLLNVKLFYSE